jgi:hypothetical protein
MKNKMPRILTVAALLAAVCLLPACGAMQDGFRMLDEGPRDYHGLEMQRYWDHSYPGQRHHGWS